VGREGKNHRMHDQTQVREGARIWRAEEGDKRREGIVVKRRGGEREGDKIEEKGEERDKRFLTGDCWMRMKARKRPGSGGKAARYGVE
jgi:hypothetical protein